ncbi:MAG: tetratricopeptide repeat protein [Methyloprofundus sp.]|nr:tetratricopeptide repeat protein [Methyloprofundus sp.]
MHFIRPIFWLVTIVLYSSLSLAVPRYVGEQACQSCHQQQVQQWQGSHHDLAMQEAAEKTVLGDFSGVTFQQAAITTTFFKNKERFMVNTDGVDGKLADFEINYTFGVYPLQQYMVKFPQGKVQVLDIAWDSRSKEQGGQRWFSLHPNEEIKAGDVLHWTGPNLNWNYMCADCHSTNLKKNYSVEQKSYTTQWDAMNVSCEACHGPASEHISWAKSAKKVDDNGLSIHLSAANQHGYSKAKQPQAENIDRAEVQLCAKCHSRRAQLDDDFVPGDNFRDHYLPSLLAEPLYYADGKIKDEVYVYGSFQQSRMYQAGVTCSDCHNPHTLELKAEGSAVCQQCHLAKDYATAKHHFHAENSKGANCIACHMPAKTYMGVDERNDHSFRIPRPDLAGKLAAPDACTLCHKDKQPEWAASALSKWYGKTPQGYQQFGPALHALALQKQDALTLSYGVLMTGAPNIAKATVVGHLGYYPSKQTLMTALQMLRSKDADTRRQALQALHAFPLNQTIAQVYAALSDPVKIVRLEAANILASVPRGALEKSQRKLIDTVTEEYRQSLLFIAERPEAQLSLARLYYQLGQLQLAEQAFKEALRLQPQFVPVYINYADFLQQQKQETVAFELLNKGLAVTKDAAIHHALGLWYIRHNDKGAALKQLKIAAELEPDTARYAYVYAVAIAEKSPKQAITILEEALLRQEGNLDLLMALAGYYQQLGDMESTQKYRLKMDAVMQYHLN